MQCGAGGDSKVSSRHTVALADGREAPSLAAHARLARSADIVQRRSSRGLAMHP